MAGISQPETWYKARSAGGDSLVVCSSAQLGLSLLGLSKTSCTYSVQRYLFSKQVPHPRNSLVLGGPIVSAGGSICWVRKFLRPTCTITHSSVMDEWPRIPAANALRPIRTLSWTLGAKGTAGKCWDPGLESVSASRAMAHLTELH